MSASGPSGPLVYVNCCKDNSFPKDFKLFNTLSGFQIDVYLGRAGHLLKIPFINRLTIGSDPILTDVFAQILMNMLRADRAVPMALYLSPELNK